MTVLQEALVSFGLQSEEEQAALLENMFFEGAFEPGEVWDSLHRLHGVKMGQESETAREAFHSFTGALKRAGAYRERPEAFDADALLECDLSKAFSLEDMQDFITYSRQSSYGRMKGMERFQLEDDQRLSEVKGRYMSNARVLGMVDAVHAPAGAAYDESWVQGASRIRMESRLGFLLEQAGQGVELGKVCMVTANNRLAHAPFDGITQYEEGRITKSGTEEGVEYLTGLAAQLGILPSGEPVRKPVYAKNSDKKIGDTIETMRDLTEGDIARDILRRAAEEHEELLQDSKTVEASKDGHNLRADTETASLQAMQELMARMRAGELADRPVGKDGKKQVRILNVIDQPFITRVDMQLQRLVDDELKKHPELAEYKVTVDSIGKGCGIGSLPVIKSDSAALARQQHQKMETRWHEPRAHSTEALLFNNREMRELQTPARPEKIIGRLRHEPALPHAHPQRENAGALGI